jgi:tetratricopeptide (TPR) repeat protein
VTDPDRRSGTDGDAPVGGPGQAMPDGWVLEVDELAETGTAPAVAHPTDVGGSVVPGALGGEETDARAASIAWPAADVPPAPPTAAPPPIEVPSATTGTWTPEPPVPATDDLLEWPAAESRPPTSWVETATNRAHVTATGGGLDAAGTPSTTRAVDGRLARVHLRGGLLTLARASLEQMAGVGALDREALADLAEARWRSGDLEGAAEAAVAHLDAGGDEPIAHLIVAEEADRQGSIVDARRHAAVVRERVAVGLDRLFAGEPRSTAWPMELPDWMDDGATGPGRWGLLAGGHEVADPEPGRWRLVPPPVTGAPVPRSRVSLATAALGAGQTTLDQLALGRAAGQELEAAERELAVGMVADAIDRLALVLRFDPALAPVILSMADRALLAPGDRHQGQVAIHLLRGDAYRGLGRETEAADAYQEAMRALAARATVKETQ